jgi:hypothetical protein
MVNIIGAPVPAFPSVHLIMSSKLFNDVGRTLLLKVYSEFNVHGLVQPKNIVIYIQQDATLHSPFYLETALHVSGGTITHHQERKQLHLQHLVRASQEQLTIHPTRRNVTQFILS